VTAPGPQARRATLEDLPRLLVLWKEAQLPVDDLQKRFAEFQLAQADNGVLLGAIGFRATGTEGCLHSEAFAAGAADQADALRAQFWHRAQLIAKNHGLLRAWTQCDAPFWRQLGFQPAAGDSLQKLPADFGKTERPWFWLQLREETAGPVSIEKELAMLQALQKDRSEAWKDQVKKFKMLAYLVLMFVMVLVLLAVFAYLKGRGQAPGP
jgi:N-acetylglutamate synthase-like GNAT family acetyltransferase